MIDVSLPCHPWATFFIGFVVGLFVMFVSIGVYQIIVDHLKSIRDEIISDNVLGKR